MDANEIHARIASALQVSPTRLTLDKEEGTNNVVLHLEGHAFALADVYVEDRMLTLVRRKHHPLMDEEGLLHHVHGRSAWAFDPSSFDKRIEEALSSPAAQADASYKQYLQGQLLTAKEVAAKEHESRPSGAGGGTLRILL